MIAIVTTDRNVLPTALLPLVKSHLRVDGSYDDAYISNAIQRAIARIGGATGVTINPTTATWTPAATEFVNGAATLPARPATSFTAVAGSPATDATANYSIALKWDDITGVPIQILKGASASGLVVTLTLGFTDLTTAPELLDRVLRETAHLYEHREILVPNQPYVAPDLAMDATWWMPRV